MVKKIIQKALIILIGMIKSGIVGGIAAMITGVLITRDLEVVGGALLLIIFLLPAMFLYHLSRVLNLKNRTCDIFYFLGSLPFLAMFTYGACVPGPSHDGGYLWCRYILIILFFEGIAIYIAEVVFRKLAILKG
jgi:hypothetical protein